MNTQQQKQEYDRNYYYQIKKNKQFGRGPSYQYVCRMLTKGNRTGDAYGITIPRELVEKYKLLGKKFDVYVKHTGVFVIKTQIKYVEAKE